MGYRSAFHRVLFQAAAFLLLPWIQGRLHLLRFFFEPETCRAVEKAQADFVISTGAGLVPLNLMLARENRAKSVVVMKPPFPYGLFRYDLAVIPAHDGGFVPEQSIRLLLTPSAPSASGEQRPNVLAGEVGDTAKIDTAVFLGGPTRDYGMDANAVRTLFETLEKTSAGYVVTTSRRTPEEISASLKAALPGRPGCRKLVIAQEDTRAGVAESMMAMARVLIVTEDSVSMISEAVSSGKKVVVFASGQSSKLPGKHKRFIALLEEKKAVVRASVQDIAEKLAAAARIETPSIVFDEKENLRRKLQEIL